MGKNYDHRAKFNTVVMQTCYMCSKDVEQCGAVETPSTSCVVPSTKRGNLDDYSLLD